MVDGPLRPERASAGLVTVLCLLTVALVTLIISATAQAAVGSARAQSAADAAALGAVLAGEDEARALARVNGARLVDYEMRGPCIEVLVVIGRSQARARAAAIDAVGGYAC